MKYALRIGIAIVVIVLILVLASSLKNKKNESNKIDSAPTANNTNQDNAKLKLLKGITLTPKSFDPQDFKKFFSEANEAGSIISWSGDWQELSNQNGGPKVITELSSTYKYTPLVEVQFFTQSTGKLLRPLDEKTKQEYRNSAINFIKKYKPKYFAIGIEINTLYEKFSQDFNEFATFYNEVYDSLKSESPNTNVFTIFQLEKMKGLNGGLFGGENDKNNNQWFLMDKFKSDLAAFTTYPSLIYKDPSDIPPDYYSEIKSHTSKRIAFTEIGWHSAPSPIGWESSQNKQSQFISIFFNLTKNLNKEMSIWSFLYDQKTMEPFNSMGLFENNGNPKKSWSAWAELK